MSTNHGHADDGAVHSHISSPFFYIAIFGALLSLTVLTVGQSYVDLGKLNILLVVIIASMKASLVVAFFMHLRWDNKFNAFIFIASLLFIGVFFTYTMNDTEKRGELDGDQNVKILQKTGEAAPGGFQPRKDDHAAAGGAAGAHSAGGAAPAAAPAGGTHH